MTVFSLLKFSTHTTSETNRSRFHFNVNFRNPRICPRLALRAHFVAAVAVIATSCLCVSNPASSQSATQIQNVTVPEIRNIEADKANRTSAQKKISSHLLDALKQQRNGAVLSDVPTLKAPTNASSGGKTLVDIDANVNSALLNSIKQAGGTIVNVHPEDHAIRAYIPLNKIESVAGSSSVNSIVPAAKKTTNVAQVDGEGRIAHAADTARNVFHVDGSGIKVGILSDSIDDNNNALKSAYKNGAITKAVLHVIPGQAGDGAAEGLAMAEIVHALAPGVSLYFATGNGGPAQMAANIRALQKAGCVIIVDDLTYFNESPFQDATIARAVSDVTAKGVLYFSSARNSGSKKHDTSGTWEGDFVDGGTAVGELQGDGAHRLHAFSPGVTVNKVTDANAESDRVDLFWADPLGKSINEYNLYVVDSDGHVLRSSTSSHTGTQDPYQFVEGLNPSEGIVITKSAGSASLFLHLDTGRARLSVGTDGNVRGHNASGAENAFSVAAIKAATPPAVFTAGPSNFVERFSSDGPRRMFFNADGTPVTPGDFSSHGGRVFEKPDLTAADGVSTSLPFNSGLNPFFGTSAAAPHAAAIAALVLSFDKTLQPKDVRDILSSSALLIDGQERNNNAGRGIVMAFEAVRMACAKKHATCPTGAEAVATSGAHGRPK